MRQLAAFERAAAERLPEQSSFREAMLSSALRMSMAAETLYPQPRLTLVPDDVVPAS